MTKIRHTKKHHESSSGYCYECHEQKPPKQTIATIAKECLAQENCTYLDMGKFGLLEEIYDRAFKRGVIKKKIVHPVDRQSYIMAQLRKSKQFKREGYIDYPGYGRAYAKCVVLTPARLVGMS